MSSTYSEEAKATMASLKMSSELFLKKNTFKIFLKHFKTFFCVFQNRIFVFEKNPGV